MEDLPHARRGAVFENESIRNLALGREPSGAIGCFAQATPSRLERWHYHDEYELHLVLETSGRAYIGDHVVCFEPGFLVLVSPRVPHNLISVGAPPAGVQERSLVIHFTEDLVSKAVALFPELRDTMSLLQRDRRGIEFQACGRELQELFRRVQAESGVARFLAFTELLQCLNQWPRFRALSSGPVQTTGRQGATGVTQRIDQALDYVYKNYTEDLSLEKASEFAGISAYGFSRLFRRVTGNTFTNFVTGVRVAKACELLSQGDQQVTTICYLAGFNNVANFNRHFRRLKNMTPSEYRKQMSCRFGAGR